MIVSCVLRKSVGFQEKHVYWLAKQVAEHMPEATFLPCSDVPLNIPHLKLERKLPAWWAKIEAFEKLPEGPVLMLDLDTVLVRPWKGVPVPEGMAYMPSFPGASSSLFGGWQLSSSGFRKDVVAHFNEDPVGRIEESEGCDQKYYVKYFRDRILPTGDVAPDLCTSYKIQVKPHGLWSQTAFVMFHGLPRPWQITEDWIPKVA